jgi:hypothetical protein
VKLAKLALMDESADRDQHDLHSSEAIALTRKALKDTCRHIRDSDQLLNISRRLSEHADEMRREDEVARGE